MNQFNENEEQAYEQPADQADGQAEQQEAVPQGAVQADENVQDSDSDQDAYNRRENNQQARFKELREARDRAAYERDEALRRLQEYEARTSASTSQPHEDEDDLSIDADSLVEGKHLKTVNKKIKQLEKSLQQATNTAIENSLRAKFADFDTVVTQESVALLRDLHPEVANVISASPDLYSKSVAAYNFIKSTGLANQKNYDMDREQAQRNANKPRPLISTKNTSPMAHVNEFANGILTEEYKNQLYKQAKEAASRA